MRLHGMKYSRGTSHCGRLRLLLSIFTALTLLESAVPVRAGEYVLVSWAGDDAGEQAFAFGNGFGAMPEIGGSGAVPEIGGGGAVPETGGGGAVPETWGGGAVPETWGGGAVPETGGSGAVPEMDSCGAMTDDRPVNWEDMERRTGDGPAESDAAAWGEEWRIAGSDWWDHERGEESLENRSQEERLAEEGGFDGADPEDNGYEEGGFHEADFEDNGSEGGGSEEDASEGEGSEGEGPEGEGSEGEGPEGEGPEGEGSEEEGSEGEGPEGEDSEGGGPEGGGSEEGGSEGEGSEAEGSEGGDSAGESSEGEDAEGEGSEGDAPEGTGSEGSASGGDDAEESGPEGGSPLRDASEQAGFSQETLPEDAETGSVPEESEPGGRDPWGFTQTSVHDGAAEGSLLPSGFPDGVRLVENPASLIPEERVRQEDLAFIIGEGIDAEIDPEADAVAELLRLAPGDQGLLQLAALRSGKTEDAATAAVEAVRDQATAVPEDTAAALYHAGLTDEESFEENRVLLERALSGRVEAARLNPEGADVGGSEAESGDLGGPEADGAAFGDQAADGTDFDSLPAEDAAFGDRALAAPGFQEPGLQEPGLQEPGLQEPDMQEPDMQEPGLQEPDMQEPDTQEPDMQEPAGVQELVGAGDDSAEDRQSGLTIPYVPADTLEDACCFVSSFVLMDVRDGAGDWDDPLTYQMAGDLYDWNGNDSSAHNQVVRTYDRITYTFAYATALGPGFVYNTVRDTRLYLSCLLNASINEAEFDLESMPWLLGDGEGGRPVVYYLLADGSVTTDPAAGEQAVSQRLVGYRELPDAVYEGSRFDVPGAGTVNCTVYVKNASLQKEIQPYFSAWLESAAPAAEPPAPESGIVRSLMPEHPVLVTLGAYVAMQYLDDNYARTFNRFGTYTFRDGDFAEQTAEGLIKQVRFRVLVGKPNGSIKGASPLAPDQSVDVEFMLKASATSGAETSAGLFDIRTADMREEDTGISRYAWNGTATSLDGVISNETPATGMEYFYGCGSLVPSSVTASGGLYRFSIFPDGNTRPGDSLAGGDILLFSEQLHTAPNYASLQYTVQISTKRMWAVSALDESGSRVEFSQIYMKNGLDCWPSMDIANTIDGAGGVWHAHLYLGKDFEDGGMSGSGMYETTGRIAYGEYFTMTSRQFFDIESEQRTEKSRKLFLLWDNRKVELDVRNGSFALLYFWNGLSGGAPSDGAASLLQGASGSKVRMVYLTKADGSLWSDEEEMNQVELLSYRDLKMWDTYERARAHGEICGLLMENFNYHFDWPSRNNTLSFTVGMRMKADPSMIGTSVKFTQSAITFKENIETSMGGPEGEGTIPDMTSVYKEWYIDTPRTYRKTEWDERGRILEESLSPHNHPHEGTSLYIEGYACRVSSQILEGGIGSGGHESLIRDLSEDNTVVYRIAPSFQTHNGVRDVRCLLALPVPRDETGTPVMQLLSLRAYGNEDTGTVLETDGREYDLSELCEGSRGTLRATTADAGAYLHQFAYTGDPLIGRRMVLHPSVAPGLALTALGGMGPQVRTYSEGSRAQIWQLVRHPGGGYALTLADADTWLAGGGQNDAQVREGQSVTYNSSRDSVSNRFFVEMDENGGCVLTLAGSGMAVGWGISDGDAEAPSGSVIFTQEHPEQTLWSCEMLDEEDEGVVIRMEGIDDDRALPVFYAVYAYDKGLLGSSSTVTQKVFITENNPEVLAEDDAHTASTGLGFVETKANVVRETVDTASIRLADLNRGARITYSVSYSNLYDRAHEVHLRVPVMRTGDEAGTVLRSGALVQVADIQTEEEGGSGFVVSTPSEANEAGAILVDGVLESGGTLLLTFSVTVTGGGGGNVLRSCCEVEAGFGDGRSNLVETRILGLAELPRLEKRVSRISNACGENQTWTVTSGIPEDFFASPEVVYSFTDLLDPEKERLDYRGNLRVALVPAGSEQPGAAGGTPDGAGDILLTEGVDYVTEEPAEGEAGGCLRLTMTETGLARMEPYAGDVRLVEVQFDTSVNTNAKAGEQIPNAVTLLYGMEEDKGQGGQGGQPAPSEELRQVRSALPDPYVYTGEIVLRKRNRSTGLAIAGAEFLLYEADGQKRVRRPDGTEYAAVSSDNGTAVFFGLRDGEYVIVESATGGTYDLLAEPFTLRVEKGLAEGGNPVIVDNSPHLALMAGGSGILLFFRTLGSILLLAAFMTVLRLYGPPDPPWL